MAGWRSPWRSPKAGRQWRRPTNQQLFALGYSACYGQAIVALGRKHGIDGNTAKITCQVTLSKDDVSFALAVELRRLHVPGDPAAVRRWSKTPTRSAPIPARPVTTSRLR